MTNSKTNQIDKETQWPTLAFLPIPMKVLLSAILITLSLGMIGALGQIIVHDIIPTFFSGEEIKEKPLVAIEKEGQGTSNSDENRGDLFADSTNEHAIHENESEDGNEQFIWTLRWTHIHLFGMSMIFIFLGAVTVFLDINVKIRSWLIALPFAGIVIDIAAMWLKAFVSPIFFWLHIPGGGLFTLIFFFVFFKGMNEMWFRDYRTHS